MFCQITTNAVKQPSKIQISNQLLLSLLNRCLSNFVSKVLADLSTIFVC